jgi:two-component system phosphate regulon response regulator PhoB
MPAARILVIEDDPSLAEIVAYNLRQADYEVRVQHDGRAGYEEACRDLPDLIVLDLMLPSMDGLEICRQLRADPRTQDVLILMLTARSEESDQVIGFAVNADDYVTKPFSVRVLVERVRVLLRRREPGSSAADVVSDQGIVVDRLRHLAMAGGRTLELTPTEFALLDTFIRNPGRAFRRGDLIDAAIGDDTIVLERTIDVHIRALRQKLGEHADVIQTVRGIGYRFRDPRSSE